MKHSIAGLTVLFSLAAVSQHAHAVLVVPMDTDSHAPFVASLVDTAPVAVGEGPAAVVTDEDGDYFRLVLVELTAEENALGQSTGWGAFGSLPSLSAQGYVGEICLDPYNCIFVTCGLAPQNPSGPITVTLATPTPAGGYGPPAVVVDNSGTYYQTLAVEMTAEEIASGQAQGWGIFGSLPLEDEVYSVPGRLPIEHWWVSENL